MLQRWNSQADSLPGLVEHECPRCHQEVDLPLGVLCTQCRREIEARARRVARRVSIGSTVVVGLYVYARMPDVELAKIVGTVGVAVWLILSNVTMRRIMREYRK